MAQDNAAVADAPQDPESPFFEVEDQFDPATAVATEPEQNDIPRGPGGRFAPRGGPPEPTPPAKQSQDTSEPVPASAPQPATEPAAPAAPAPEPVAEPSGSPGEWTQEHMAWGAALGMEPEEVKAFPTPTAFMSMAEAIYAAQSAQLQPQPVPQPQAQPPAVDYQKLPVQPAPPGVSTVVYPPDPTLTSGVPDLPELSGEEYDSDLIHFSQAVKQTVGGLQQKIDAMEQHNRMLQEQMASTLQAQQREELYAQFDRVVDGLPEERYGRGRGTQLEGQLKLNREVLADAITREAQRLEVSGRPVPPLEVLVARMDSQIFGSVANSALQRMAERSQELASQATTPPTSAESPESSDPRKAAVAAAYEWHKQRGLVPR